MNHQTDEQLVDELKNGNRAAFDFLFDRYAKKAEYYFIEGYGVMKKKPQISLRIYS